MSTPHRSSDVHIKAEEGAEGDAPPVHRGAGDGADAACQGSPEAQAASDAEPPAGPACGAEQPDGQEVQPRAANSREAVDGAQGLAGGSAAKEEADGEAVPAVQEAQQASPAAQPQQAAGEQRSPLKKEMQVELSEDALKAIDLVRRIAEQVPVPERLPEPAEDGGGRKARRPWMPDPIRKALSMLSPIYMQEVEQHGQAATRRVLDLLMPSLEPFATRHRVSVMLRSSQKERKRKAPEARSGAERPPLPPRDAAAAAFRDLQASAGGVDHIVQVAAQTRWLVRHLEDCGVGSQEAQEYQNRWVLRPATRPACWEELGRLVPAEDWEGMQRHVRLAIGVGAGSRGDGGGVGAAT